MALSRLLPCPPKAAAEVLEPEEVRAAMREEMRAAMREEMRAAMREEMRAAMREEMRAALGLDDGGAT